MWVQWALAAFASPTPRAPARAVPALAVDGGLQTVLGVARTAAVGNARVLAVTAGGVPTSPRPSRWRFGMARSASPDSANSQFFIAFADAPFLDNKYTVFGEVVSGMDVVDKIKKGSKADNGTVTGPDKMISVRLTDVK